MNEDPSRQSTDRPSDWQRWLDSHVNQELGAPQRQFRSVLVAGTNGKTTVTHTVSALIEASGYRVGRYTNPQLERVNERIAADGTPIEATRV